MNVSIDTTVTFDLPSDRHFTVDAWEFNDWMRELYKAKGTPGPLLKKGIPVQDDKGQPVSTNFLSYEVIQDEMIAYGKEHGVNDLKPHEAKLIWDGWDDKIDDEGKVIREGVFTKKKRLLEGTAPETTSPTSPSSTDPRSWE